MENKDSNRAEKLPQELVDEQCSNVEDFAINVDCKAFEKSLYSKWLEILSSKTEDIDLNHVLYKIHFEINSKKKSSPISRLYTQISKIAVLLLIPLLAFTVYSIISKSETPVEYTEITAPKGEKVQFVLPDGSSGYLNSGSTLSYSYPFGKNRVVELEGEGFFDVKHSDNEFIVKVSDLSVRVHGTRFNVCAYSNERKITTTLEEGSVSVVRNSDGKTMTIKPNQQLLMKKSNKKMYVRDVDVDLFVSWKDNMLRFENTPFIEAVKKMERWYDVKIILDKDLEYTQRYTMTIKTESLRELLTLMQVTTPMSYEIKEDTVYINSIK